MKGKLFKHVVMSNLIQRYSYSQRKETVCFESSGGMLLLCGWLQRRL